MRVVLVTDGHAEFVSFPSIHQQLGDRCGQQVVRTLKAPIPPTASPTTIATSCRTALVTARGLGASLAVVVLDREQSQDCCGQAASAIRRALLRIAPDGLDVDVVLKDRMFENWLVADLEALRQQPSRFTVSPALERAVEPGRADAVDGLREIKRAVRQGQYEKVQDGRKIMSRWSVDRAEPHSRSLRRLLAVLGDPVYSSQSRRPRQSP